MFPLGRLALMKGEHPTQGGPLPGRIYAGLLDVAGEDEGASDVEQQVVGLANPRRDSTVLTIVEVDRSTLADEVIKAPTYRVVQRLSWIGVKHSRLYGQIKALSDCWHFRYLVCDGTGVGAGLVSFLDKALPGRVIPFVFNSSTKSQLGWSWLSIIDTGRWKEPADGEQEFWNQLGFMQYVIIPGPNKTMRWSVPDGTRDPKTGDLVHDDQVLSSALSAVLDEQDWAGAGPAVVIRVRDVLGDIDRGY